MNFLWPQHCRWQDRMPIKAQVIQRESYNSSKFDTYTTCCKHVSAAEAFNLHFQYAHGNLPHQSSILLISTLQYCSNDRKAFSFIAESQNNNTTLCANVSSFTVSTLKTITMGDYFNLALSSLQRKATHLGSQQGIHHVLECDEIHTHLQGVLGVV